MDILGDINWLAVYLDTWCQLLQAGLSLQLGILGLDHNRVAQQLAAPLHKGCSQGDFQLALAQQLAV